MDMNRVEQAIENKIIADIGSCIKLPYGFIDGTPFVQEALKKVDMEKVMQEVTEQIQHELARKMVDKVVTEMGTDIKELMSHKEIRDDFKYMLRKNIDLVFEKINKE